MVNGRHHYISNSRMCWASIFPAWFVPLVMGLRSFLSVMKSMAPLRRISVAAMPKPWRFQRTNSPLKPKGMSHTEAAAIALVGLTALVSLDDVAGLKSGETILVHAAAGGVGGFAVQYAKHVGAKVYATASAANHDYVKSLGADVVIDYRNQDFTEVAKDCDVVYETVGGEVLARSVSVLKPGGRLVYITKPPEGFVAPDNIEYLRPKVPRDGGHMAVISNLIDQGAVWAPEITEMSLGEIKKAHELSATEHVRGKIVLVVR